MFTLIFIIAATFELLCQILLSTCVSIYSITPSIEADAAYNFGNLILTKIPISWILYDHPRPSNGNLMCFSKQVYDLLKLRHVWNDIKLLFKTLICNLFLIFITFIYFKCVWFRCTLSGGEISSDLYRV